MTKKIKTLNKVAIGVATAIAMSYGPAVSAGETQWSGYVENATYFRDKKGLSKFRNTAQAEFYKPVESEGWSNVSINGVLIPPDLVILCVIAFDIACLTPSPSV